MVSILQYIELPVYCPALITGVSKKEIGKSVLQSWLLYYDDVIGVKSLAVLVPTNWVGFKGEKSVEV